MPTYRLTLYRSVDQRAHFCQLTASHDGQHGSLRTATGVCGTGAEEIREEALGGGVTAQSALEAAGALWRRRGYDYPKRHELKIMTLHFSVPGWTGFPAGAPWFEDWKTHYQEPFEAVLEGTVNGFPRGGHRSKGHMLLYYYVLNPEAARAACEAVAARAPVKLPLTIHVGTNEMRPDTTLDAGVPGPLAGLLHNFGDMAQTVAEASHNILFHTVALMPQLIHQSARQRIKGAQAMELRRALDHRWGFDCHLWPPLGGAARSEVVYVRDFPSDKTAALQERLLEKVVLPAYLLDCDDGIFRLEPDHLLRGAYEGVVFDASLDWVIYFSHHHTVTFGGEWLIRTVRELYRHEPLALHPA
jgi:hypothetical protein